MNDFLDDFIVLDKPDRALVLGKKSKLENVKNFLAGKYTDIQPDKLTELECEFIDYALAYCHTKRIDVRELE